MPTALIPPVPIARFRDMVRERPLAPYDELDTTPKHDPQLLEVEVDRMLTDGWGRDGTWLPSLAPPVQWKGFNRSFVSNLHAWQPLTFLLQASRVIANPAKRVRYLETSRAYAMDWLNTFQRPVIHMEPKDALPNRNVEAPLPIWYDMAVGQRIYRLAYILDVMCRDETASDDDVEFVYRSLRFHYRVLMVDGFFKPHSNHGIYQALGQVAAGKRFSEVDPFSKNQFEIGRARVAMLLERHFTPDNVHKEHSPAYHYMILGSLVGATELVGGDIGARILGMERGLTWMVQPNGVLATFGDTDPRMMSRGRRLAERFSDATLQSIVSQNAIGTPPPSGVKEYRDAGYAFARLHAPGVEPSFANASYLGQIAAFHSRVHKQADHLGFVWHDRRRDILIDPGRYAYEGRTEIGSDLFNDGFWYSNPKRIYVESTRAHNCVEIDSRNYPRRRMKPFGSALRYAGEQNGLAVTDCEVTHFRSVRHRRVLVMAPGHFLLVLDWLNDRAAPHDYRQWFQFAPEWTLESLNDRLIARAPADGPDETARPAEAVTIFEAVGENAFAPPVRGQEEPRLQGWMSDAPSSLVPSTSLAVEAKERSMARLATLLVFGDAVELDRQRTRFNASLRNGRIVWRDTAGDHTLELVLGLPGEASARSSSAPVGARAGSGGAPATAEDPPPEG